jgi:hypothetical protein
LTVLKNNTHACDFYAKMKYSVDADISAAEPEAAHVILTKVVNKAAADAIKARAEEEEEQEEEKDK